MNNKEIAPLIINNNATFFSAITARNERVFDKELKTRKIFPKISALKAIVLISRSLCPSPILKEDAHRTLPCQKCLFVRKFILSTKTFVY
jgi:hypothetical protein